MATLAAACGDDSGVPPVGGVSGVGGDGGMSGAAGMAGAAGTAGTAGTAGMAGAAGAGGDAQVPVDAGTDAAVLADVGRLIVAIEGLAAVEDKDVLVDLQVSASRASVGGVCATVTSDPYSESLSVTRRTSDALCDFGAEDRLPVGSYTVVVMVQEPEVFPPILCAELAATVADGETSTVTAVPSDFYPCEDAGQLRDGNYVGSTLSCATDPGTTRLVHTDPDVAATILDFDDVTITAQRAGMQWTETYADNDCQLRITRTIMTDDTARGVLVFDILGGRTFTWTPANCTFSVTVDGTTTQYGSSFSGLQQSALLRGDDLWTTMQIGNSYRFTTVPGTWEAGMPPAMVPCEMNVSLARLWTRQ